MKLITTCILLLFVSINTYARDRIALVIGNSDYQVSPLDNPINDARDVASTLKGLNFKVTLVEDANQQTMEEAITSFGEKLNKDTVGLFYYSGHAIQYNGSNYLIPVGALSKVKKSSHLKYKTVPSGLVLDELEQSQSKLNFVFLDACRDNPFKGFSKGIYFGLVKPESAQGTLISYSTAPGEVALDGAGKNSPYTKHLLSQITKQNVQVELMLKEVNAAVLKATNGEQSPWYESSISGKFCFNEVDNKCGILIIDVTSDLKSLEERFRLLEEENNVLKEQLYATSSVAGIAVKVGTWKSGKGELGQNAAGSARVAASTSFGGVKLSYADRTGAGAGGTDTTIAGVKLSHKVTSSRSETKASGSMGGVSVSAHTKDHDIGSSDASVTLKTEVQGVALTYADTSSEFNLGAISDFFTEVSSSIEEGITSASDSINESTTEVQNIDLSLDAIKAAIFGEPEVVEKIIYKDKPVEIVKEKIIYKYKIIEKIIKIQPKERSCVTKVHQLAGESTTVTTCTEWGDRMPEISDISKTQSQQDYVQQIALKVKDNWHYKGAKNNWSCDVHILQDEQGNIKSVNVQSCVVDNKAKMKSFRDSIERAVNKASPLPQAPSSEIFAPEILFHFKVN